MKVGTTEADPYDPAVTAVFESAIVTGVEPLNDPPDKPVLIVKALVVAALIVVEPPKLTRFPLMVIELLAN